MSHILQTSRIVALVGISLVTQVAFANKTTFNTTDNQIASLDNLQSLKEKTSLKHSKLNVIKFTTTTGTPVLFVKATQLPVVDMNITFNAGSARDSFLSKENKILLQGTASLTASMLNKGITANSALQTPSLSESDIANTIEQNGLSFASNAYKDMFSVSMRSVSAPYFLEQSTTLLNQMLVNPSFPQESLERIKQQRMLSLQQAQKNPQSLASRAFYKALYGTHPYALPTSGSLNSIPNITRKHLQQFKNTFLVAKNASIAITGNISVTQAKNIAEDVTRNMLVGEKAKKLPKPKKPKAQNIHIDFPESSQTTILAGQLGIDTFDSHKFDLLVANKVFGGGDFQAKLMQELRKKRGLTYGAYSSFTPMYTKGPFRINFSTRTEQAATALKVMKKTLRDYVRKGATAAEIEETKLSMTNKFPLGIATNSSINQTLAMMAFYDFPTDYINNYVLNIMAVTQHSANTSFARSINNKNMIIVTVGSQKP